MKFLSFRIFDQFLERFKPSDIDCEDYKHSGSYSTISDDQSSINSGGETASLDGEL